jgi:ATP-dependent HslUV protease subunit HslV
MNGGHVMIRGTTIVAVLDEGRGAMAGDGQVTLENRTIIKQQAHKVRRLYDGKVLAGFAGSVADAFTLFEKFEGKLKEFRGNLPRAAVELAKDWRTDKVLRRLEALLLVMDKNHLLLVSGGGEVIEPDDRIAAIGSGGPYALAAARALKAHTTLEPRRIAEEALKIASSICVFTNDTLTVEDIGLQEE